MALRSVPILFAFLLFLLAVLFFFPLSAAGSGAIYLPLMFIAISLIFSPRKAGLMEALDYLGLSPKKGKLPYLLSQGLLALMAALALSISLSFAFELFGMPDNSGIADAILGLSLPVLVSSVTLVPLAEEALFRGLLFRRASEMAGASGSFLAAHSWAFGAVISSAIFAALHFSYGSISEIIAAFSIALLFCFFTSRSKSIIPAVLAHAAFNFISIIYVMVFV